MHQGTILWLVVLLALVALFLLTLRRMSVLVARTRDLERFQRAVATLDRQLAVTIDPLVVALDEIRRRAGDPQALASQLEPAQETLRELAAEGRRLRTPRGLVSAGAAIVAELERASRAADLVEHGLDALMADRGGRDLEAQTSLKRGALNLRHAREACARFAAEVAAVRPGDLLARAGGRGGAMPARGPATFLVDGSDADENGTINPRM